MLTQCNRTTPVLHRAGSGVAPNMWSFNALIKAHCHADSLGGALKARDLGVKCCSASSDHIVVCPICGDTALLACRMTTGKGFIPH